ncbi:MAG: hypothetical protein ACE5D8_10200 [Fidelibacterota bacterium]
MSTCWKRNVFLLLLLSGLLAQQGEIILLTPTIGTEIDAAENAYYRIFQEIKGFKNAHFFEQEDGSYMARIAFVEFSHQRITRKRYSQREFFRLQQRLERAKPMPPDYRINAEKEFTYLESKTILSSIPTEQYVVIRHRDGDKLRGSLKGFDGERIVLQTATTRLTVPVWNMNSISYRQELQDRSSWRNYLLLIGTGLGYKIAQFWNHQHEFESGRKGYNIVAGSLIGLLLGNESLQLVALFTTPRKTYALTPEDQSKIKDFLSKLRTQKK